MPIVIWISKSAQRNFGSNVKKPDSNCENDRFEYWHLNILLVFVFLSSSRKISGFYHKLRYIHLFPSHYSLIVNCSSSVSVVIRLRTRKTRGVTANSKRIVSPPKHEKWHWSLPNMLYIKFQKVDHQCKGTLTHS